MSELPDIILNQTLEEFRTLKCLKTQAENGPGFWVILGDTLGRYCDIEKIALVYPQLTIKQQRAVARMVRRADLTRQAVISFHLPDGKLVIDTWTIE